MAIKEKPRVLENEFKNFNKVWMNSIMLKMKMIS